MDAVMEYVVATFDPQQLYPNQRVLEAGGDTSWAFDMLKMLESTCASAFTSSLPFGSTKFLPSSLSTNSNGERFFNITRSNPHEQTFQAQQFVLASFDTNR